MAISPEAKSLFNTLKPHLGNLSLEMFSSAYEEALKFRQFEPIKSTFETFEANAKEVKESLSKLEHKQNELQQKQGELEKFKKMRTRSPNIDKKAAEVEAETKQIEVDAKQIETDIGTNAPFVAASFKDVMVAIGQYKQNAFDDVQKRFTESENARRSLEAVLKEKTDELNELKSAPVAVAPVAAAAPTVVVHTAEQSARIDELEAEIAQLKSDLGKKQDEFNTLFTEKGSLEEQLKTANSDKDKAIKDAEIASKAKDEAEKVKCKTPGDHHVVDQLRATNPKLFETLSKSASDKNKKEDHPEEGKHATPGVVPPASSDHAHPPAKPPESTTTTVVVKEPEKKKRSLLRTAVGVALALFLLGLAFVLGSRYGYSDGYVDGRNANPEVASKQVAANNGTSVSPAAVPQLSEGDCKFSLAKIPSKEADGRFLPTRVIPIDEPLFTTCPDRDNMVQVQETADGFPGVYQTSCRFKEQHAEKE